MQKRAQVEKKRKVKEEEEGTAGAVGGVGPAGKGLGRNRFRWFHWAGLGAMETKAQGRLCRLCCLRCCCCFELQVAVEGREGVRKGVDASGDERGEEAVVNESLVMKGRWKGSLIVKGK